MSDPTSIKTQSEAEDGRLLARSQLYRALALLFRHPGKEHLDLLIRKGYRDWPKLARMIEARSESQVSEKIKALTKELERTSLAEWLTEHQRLFGHTAHGAAPPYELEYGEEHSHREPQELGDIAAFYQAFGLKLGSNVHERVDHVAVEFDFLHFLTFKEALALEETEEKVQICHQARRHFLRDHLGRWLPVFTLRISRASESPLFRALADFSFEFVVDECLSLGVTPGPRDLPLRTLERLAEVDCSSCSLVQNENRSI